MFDQFQYCLNLGSSKPSPQNFDNNSIVSVFINIQTNIQSVAYKLCKENNIEQNIVPILMQSIQSEIIQQIQLYKKSKKNKIQRNLCKNIRNDNKLKNFKNKFCQYLNQMSKQQQETEQILFNSFEIDNNQQYSFRPTYMRMLDLGDYEEQCYKKNNLLKSNKQNQKSSTAYQKSERNVFEDLYSKHRLIQFKKQIQRKKSIQKLTFQPQINKMSRKIIQMKNSYKVDKLIPKSKDNLQNSSVSTSYNSKSNLFVKPKVQKYQISQFEAQRKLLNQLNIYERGELYLKKSRQKIDKMIALQMLKQMGKCTFKPVLLSKSRSKSRISRITYDLQN